MSDYKHFYNYNDILYLYRVEDCHFGNIKMVDILKSNADSSISKPTHLRYLKKPPLSAYPLDFSEYANDYVDRNEDYPTSVLYFIEHHLMRNEILNMKPEITTKICTRRSVLVEIMLLTVFKGELDLYVTKFKDTLYLSFYDGYESTMSPLTKLQHKFEQICFAENPNKDPDTDQIVDENVQWAGIFRGQLKHFDIIYSAEVLGVDAKEEINDLSDMEKLNKCNFVLLQLGEKRIPFAKSLKAFLHAKLLNAEDLYLANNTNAGIIEEPMQHVTVETNIRNPDKLWKKCSGFLFNFLMAVEKKMHDIDCPYTVYQFMHVPEEKRFKLRILNGKNDFTFLTDEFVQHTLQQKI